MSARGDRFTLPFQMPGNDKEEKYGKYLQALLLLLGLAWVLLSKINCSVVTGKQQAKCFPPDLSWQVIC